MVPERDVRSWTSMIIAFWLLFGPKEGINCFFYINRYRKIICSTLINMTNTLIVLLDIQECEKVKFLYRHCEQLAIVFCQKRIEGILYSVTHKLP